MNNEFYIEERAYVDYIIYETTTIKKKYGYRIKLIFADGSSRTVQRSGYNTKKESNDCRRTSIAELENHTFIIDRELTFERFLIYWLEKVMRSKITNDSYIAYKNIVYNHIIPKLGKKKITSLNRGHIQKFYNEEAEKSESCAKLDKAVMNSALKYALNKKLIKMNPSEGVNLPKFVKKQKYRIREIDTSKTLNEEQVNLLIKEGKKTPIYLHILFAVLMGLRKGEINGLKYDDVDFIHRKIQIRRQLGKKPNTDNKDVKVGEYTKQEIKVKTFSSNRELDIPDIVFEAILEERKKYEKNRNRRINDKHNPFKDYGFICCSTYGNPRSKDFHFKYWKQLLKDCGLPDIRFHDLRATYCTLLLKNNFSPKAVSQLLGHSSEIISVDVYGDNKQLVADRLIELDEFIESVAPKEELNIQIEVDKNLIEGIDSYIKELVI